METEHACVRECEQLVSGAFIDPAQEIDETGPSFSVVLEKTDSSVVAISYIGRVGSELPDPSIYVPVAATRE